MIVMFLLTCLSLPMGNDAQPTNRVTAMNAKSSWSKRWFTRKPNSETPSPDAGAEEAKPATSKSESESTIPTNAETDSAKKGSEPKPANENKELADKRSKSWNPFLRRETENIAEQQPEREVDAEPEIVVREVDLESPLARVPLPKDVVPNTERQRVNWNLKTGGGAQFWSDELIHGEWRIQVSTISGHYRLLDPNDVRRAWGTYQQCRAKFEELRDQGRVAPLRPRVILTLHGLTGVRGVMGSTGDFLANKLNATLINVSYASTRRSIDEHALSLARIVDHLQDADEFYVVAHSMGNLVVRRYLAMCDAREHGCKPDPRFRRMVMLGPPNHGAQLAERFQSWAMVRGMLGPGLQLMGKWQTFEERFAIPQFQFGIIAGNKSNNPLLKGDDDLLVTVDETKLPGARDFLVLPVAHFQLTKDTLVRERVLKFIEHGHFEQEATRDPIPIKQPNDDDAEER